MEKKQKILTYFSFLLLLVTLVNTFAWQYLIFLFFGFLAASFEWLKNKSLVYSLILFFAACLVSFHFRQAGYCLVTNPLIASCVLMKLLF